MTVQELIELLKTFPQDAKVAFTVESMVHAIDAEDVYLAPNSVVLIGDDYKNWFMDGRLIASI